MTRIDLYQEITLEEQDAGVSRRKIGTMLLYVEPIDGATFDAFDPIVEAIEKALGWPLYYGITEE